MTPHLPPPWAGLAPLARRLDLWPTLRALGGPARAVHSPPSAWCAAGLPLDALPALTAAPWRGRAIHAGAPEWPSALDDLPLGPVALQVEGDVALLQRPMVAIVGARACTAYGREWAARLAAAVADAGGVVVSGLATGIDAAAHDAAPGATVAVLGQALDRPTPGWQARLRARLLAAGGLVVSEFAPGTHADVTTFPIRNRIVAGLARAVVVVEAAHKSGAKNTVVHALRYGREVLAVPGPLGADASAGCLDLIEAGAEIVRGPSTVLEAAGLVARPTRDREGAPDHARVLAALVGASTPEDIATRSGLPLRDVLAALGGLELGGRVVRLPGRRYVPAPG